MVLIFKKDEQVKKIIPLDDYPFDNIIYGSNNVKEISFCCTINNSDELKLQTLYEQIEKIDYTECNEVIVLYNQEHYYSFKAPIKEVLYRTCSYIGNKNYELQENLAIRFLEDNNFIFNEELNTVFCNKKCQYFNEKNCKKYDADLIKINDDFLICKQCFLEIEVKIKNDFYRQLFMNMSKNLDIK